MTDNSPGDSDNIRGSGRHAEAEEPRVVVRDRRKIDPETGQLRTAEPEVEPVPPTAEPAQQATPVREQATGDEQHDVRAELEERTADLQRLQAEYANYRKRTAREREQVAAGAKAGLVGELLPVLDDIDRAESHGDLTGAFKAVADKLAGALQQAGLEPFGHSGDEFDPNVHEAVQHATSPDVSGPTVTAVLRHGYRFGDKVVRAALVAVTDYEAPQGAAATTDSGDAENISVPPKPGAAEGN